MIVVLAGLAGSGKTELLRHLAARGEQVLDLEALASHRGSAFGGIGMPPQPSHVEFLSAVRARLHLADPRRALWVEDEGPFIGSVGLPAELQQRIASAPVVELETPFDDRVARIQATYHDADPQLLVQALARSRRRLGSRLADAAAAQVWRGDLSGAIALVLPYFDASYRHRAAAYGRGALENSTRGRRAYANVRELIAGEPRSAAADAVDAARAWTARSSCSRFARFHTQQRSPCA
jgi:tRNA 2-selenouridine synthase